MGIALMKLNDLNTNFKVDSFVQLFMSAVVNGRIRLPVSDVPVNAAFFEDLGLQGRTTVHRDGNPVVQLGSPGYMQLELVSAEGINARTFEQVIGGLDDLSEGVEGTPRRFHLAFLVENFSDVDVFAEDEKYPTIAGPMEAPYDEVNTREVFLQGPDGHPFGIVARKGPDTHPAIQRDFPGGVMLDHVGIWVSDFHRSFEFYDDILDLEMEWDMHYDLGDYHTLDTWFGGPGGLRVQIMQDSGGETTEATPVPEAIERLEIPLRNYDDVVNRIEADSRYAMEEIDRGEDTTDNAVSVRDPDEFRVKLTDITGD